MTRRFAFSLLLLTACGSSVDTPADATSTGSSGGTTDVDPTSTTTGAGESSTTAPAGSSSGATSTGQETGGGDSSSSGGVPQGPCDPFEQDCPAGFKCAPVSEDGASFPNATACVPVADDPVGVGEACAVEGEFGSGLDNCDVGSVCFSFQDPFVGECVAQCGGSPFEGTCPAGSSCAVTADGVLNFCVPDCDPLDADTCEPGQVCVPNPGTNSFNCAADASGEGGAEGSPCEFATACDPGLACVSPVAEFCTDEAAVGCCLPFCSLSAPSCPDPLTCLPWFEDTAPEGYEDVGLCFAE
ncbi:MAG: hypothetical protein AAGA54_12510 [Myxococcota bacterium]